MIPLRPIKKVSPWVRSLSRVWDFLAEKYQIGIISKFNLDPPSNEKQKWRYWRIACSGEKIWETVLKPEIEKHVRIDKCLVIPQHPKFFVYNHEVSQPYEVHIEVIEKENHNDSR